MKVVQVNPVCTASTGKIAVEISKLLSSENIENYIYYTSGSTEFENAVKYANDKIIKINALFAKVLGNYGFNSKIITKRLISELKRIKPDVIHLHNIHGHNVNLEMLFSYLKGIDVKIFWTFHDCWAFTAYCTHFDYIGCDKWKGNCRNCPQRKSFSWFFDRSTYLYNKKKELFSGLDMTVITPSEWLMGLVKQSFFGEYPAYVINNGIDLDLFKPTKSDFREKHGFQDKKILLGVAMGFDARKGYNDFIELSKRVDKSTVIVMVGVSEEQRKALPKNVLGIERTANQRELAEIYTAADIFVNLTYEDNFPTVNLEALACGTPVLTYATGGSVEVADGEVGFSAEKGDLNGVLKVLSNIEKSSELSKKCRLTSEKRFKAEDCFKKYLELYNKAEKY